MRNKLIIDKVRAKNFRSISNMFMEIDLTKNDTTLIVSTDNGAGKSTLLVHSLWFAFFDKPYKKSDRKPSLVNSRNNKDCVVEVDFRKAGKQYMLRRGIKPNIFEIYENGVLLSAEAGNADYQAKLEDILGFDEKACQNQIILAVDRFVPFAEMTAPDRRAHLERCLDLNVISVMSDLAKKELKELSLVKSDIEFRMTQQEGKKAIAQNTISVLNEAREKQNEELDQVVTKATLEISLIDDKVVNLKTSLEEIVKDASKLDVREQMQKLKDFRIRFISERDALQKRISQYEHLNVCPTCAQDVSEEHIEKMVGDDRNNLQAILEKIEAADKKIVELQEVDDQMRELMQQGTDIKNQITSLTYEKDSLVKNREWAEKQKNASDDSEKMAKAVQDLDAAIENIKALEAELNESNEEVEVQNQLILMLKDDGVRAKIVAEYIPIVNAKTNMFLQKMNFFVNIEVDEEGTLTLLGADRSNQQLGSLSTGQLRRIDLALMFAWREISSMKSTIDINLLVLDEILENLSESGVQDFMNFYESTFKSEGVNLFVISQRNTEFSEYFDDVIKFNLKDGFTEMLEASD